MRAIHDELGPKQQGPARNSAGPRKLWNMSTRTARVSLDTKLAPDSGLGNGKFKFRAQAQFEPAIPRSNVDSSTASRRDRQHTNATHPESTPRRGTCVHASASRT